MLIWSVYPQGMRKKKRRRKRKTNRKMKPRKYSHWFIRTSTLIPTRTLIFMELIIITNSIALCRWIELVRVSGDEFIWTNSLFFFSLKSMNMGTCKKIWIKLYHSENRFLMILCCFSHNWRFMNLLHSLFLSKLWRTCWVDTITWTRDKFCSFTTKIS